MEAQSNPGPERLPPMPANDWHGRRELGLCHPTNQSHDARQSLPVESNQ
jgi:hypothetical protein